MLHGETCGVGSAPCGAAQPREHIMLVVGCTAPLVPPSPPWHGTGQSCPPLPSGVQPRPAAGTAVCWRLRQTSICYKLGGNSHVASPRILQCRSPQPCSAAVINSLTPPALSCCRSRLSPVSPLSSLFTAGEKAAHTQLPPRTYACTAALSP